MDDFPQSVEKNSGEISIQIVVHQAKDLFHVKDTDQEASKKGGKKATKDSKKAAPKQKEKKSKKGKGNEKVPPTAGTDVDGGNEIRFPMSAVASSSVFAEMQVAPTVETMSKVIEDVSPLTSAQFSFIVTGTITSTEQFLDSICSTPLNIKVFQWTSDDKKEKKAAAKVQKPVKKKEGKDPKAGAPAAVEEKEPAGPLVSNGELTLIGSVDIDLSVFHTGATLLEDWFDLAISPETLEIGKRVAELQARLRAEDVSEASATHRSSSKMFQDSTPPFHQLCPRVQVSVMLSRPLISPEESKSSNRLTIEMLGIQRLPFKWSSGLPATDFTQEFSVSYDVQLTDSFRREATLSGGVIKTQPVVVEEDTVSATVTTTKVKGGKKKSKKGSTKSKDLDAGPSKGTTAPIIAIPTDESTDILSASGDEKTLQDRSVHELKVPHGTNLNLPKVISGGNNPNSASASAVDSVLSEEESERPTVTWPDGSGKRSHFLTHRAMRQFERSLTLNNSFTFGFRAVRRPLDEKEGSLIPDYSISAVAIVSLRALLKPGAASLELLIPLQQINLSKTAADLEKEGKKARPKKPRKKDDIADDFPQETLEQAGTALSVRVSLEKALTPLRPTPGIDALLTKSKSLLLAEETARKVAEESDNKDASLTTNIRSLTRVANSEPNVLPGLAHPLGFARGLDLFGEELNNIVDNMVSELSAIPNSETREEEFVSRLHRSAGVARIHQRLRPVIDALFAQLSNDGLKTATASSTGQSEEQQQEVLRQAKNGLLNLVAIRLAPVLKHSINALSDSDPPKLSPDAALTLKIGALGRMAIHAELSNHEKLAAQHHGNRLTLCLEKTQQGRKWLLEHDPEHQQALVFGVQGSNDPAWAALLAQCWLDFGTFCLRRGDIDESEECFRKAIALDKKNVVARTLRTCVYCELDRYEQAGEEIQLACALLPNHPLLLALKALCHDIAEEDVEREQSFAAAAKCFQNKWLKQYSTLQTENGQFEDDLIDQILGDSICGLGNRASAPLAYSPSVYILLSRFLSALHLYTLSQRVLAIPTQSATNPGPPSLSCMQSEEFSRVLELGFLHAVSSKHSESKRLFDGAISNAAMSQPSRESAHMWVMCGHAAILREDRESAEMCYRNYLDIFRAYDSDPRYHAFPMVLDPLACLRLGQCFLDSEKFSSALALFSMLVSHPFHRYNPYAWLGLGVASLRLERFYEAELALVEASALDDQNGLVWAHTTLLCLLTEQRTDFNYRHSVDEAKQAFHMTLQLELDNPVLFAEIAFQFQSVNELGLARLAAYRAFSLEDSEGIRAVVNSVEKAIEAAEKTTRNKLKNQN